MSGFIHIVNYTAISATISFHETPRFGRSNEFALLFSENQAEQSDYIRGLLFTGVLIFTFFFVWLILLLVFKCLGRKVGFLSGARMIDPGTGRCTRRNAVRFIFCLSTVIAIVFAILLKTKGLEELSKTTKSLEQSNNEAASILTQFQGIATNIRTVGATARQTRTQILDQLGNICPDGPNFVLRTGVALQSVATRAAHLLEALGDFFSVLLFIFQVQLALAQHTSENLNEALHKFNFHGLGVAVVVLYLVLSTCMLAGVLLAWFGISKPSFQRILSWLVLPMWVIMIIFGVVSTAVSAWLVAANSDFCSGGNASTPDDTLEQILAFRNVTLAEYLGQISYFYISQCRLPDPWAFLQAFQLNLTMANESVATLASDLNQVGLPVLHKICGGNFTPLEDLLLSMESTLTALIADAALARQLWACDNIVPIYTTTVYTTACDYSVLALAWTFAAFLVVSFFGMIMITLRTSWLDVMYIDNKEEAKNVEPDDAHPERAVPVDEDLPESNQEDQHDIVYDDEPKIVREFDGNVHEDLETQHLQQ